MKELRKRDDLIKQKLDFEGLRRQVREIEALSSHPEFWQDQQEAAEKMKKLSSLNKEINEIEELEKLLAAGETTGLEKKIAKLELQTFLCGKYDHLPAIFSIHAGQGGVEAMDWAAMLKRMYLRYFERRGWGYQIVEETLGDEAGIKSISLIIDGSYAYGCLKIAAGTHRLVRQSPFNADKLRQTSFALVEVLPKIESSSEVDINENDLETQFYHASSHGGQNVQKVSTAVRIKHKPTGITVSSQSQRYQEQNRKIALEILQAKLWALNEAKAKAEEQKLKGGRTQAAWGTQIRSYVLHPYKMVKDLRTGYETGDAQAVLDGELEGLVEAELRSVI